MHNIKKGKVSNLYFFIQTYIFLGNGFLIRLGNQIYEFPTAEWAPPETYLLYGYQAYIFIFISFKHSANSIFIWAHTDKSYTFSFCADSSFTESFEPEHSIGGSRFVNIGLKVIVQQDTGTVVAFKPDNLHGTTLSHGVGNSILAITFYRRVNDAWAEALENQGRISIS